MSILSSKLNHPECTIWETPATSFLAQLPRDPRSGHRALRRLCDREPAHRGPTRARHSFQQQPLPSALHRHFCHPIFICSFHAPSTSSPGSVSRHFLDSHRGIVGMIGAGVNPVKGLTVSLTNSESFVNSFGSVTNPVFAYAGHFMFFILISEMRNPCDAMKAAYVLQGFATTFYAVFAIQQQWYLGMASRVRVSSVCLPNGKGSLRNSYSNFLIAGSLYSHTAAKLVFLRLFRNSKHLHSHTLIGWCSWSFLILVMNAAAFVLAVGFPYFLTWWVSQRVCLQVVSSQKLFEEIFNVF